MKIYNLGSLNIDYVYRVPHFVCPGETLSSTDRQVFPGGKGLNQSVALARAGASVIHGAVIGKEGGFLVDELAAAGVNTAYIRTVGGATGHAVIQVDAAGQNCILLFPGTNRCVESDYVETLLADAQAGDILLVQNETSGLDTAFALAHEKGMQIAFNPSPFDDTLRALPLAYVDWWFCNEIEGAALFGGSTPGEIAAGFSARYPDSRLVLTLGGDGSLYRAGDTTLRQSVYKVQAVDTTAAGDTFTGYFLAAVAAGECIERALKRAAKAAAIAVSRHGAAVSIPYADEVVV